MNKSIKGLSSKDIEEIKYISGQGSGKINRIRLITNLYKISKEELYEILNNN